MFVSASINHSLQLGIYRSAVLGLKKKKLLMVTKASLQQLHRCHQYGLMGRAAGIGVNDVSWTDLFRRVLLSAHPLQFGCVVRKGT